MQTLLISLISFYFGAVFGFWFHYNLMTFILAWRGLFLGTSDKYMSIPPIPILPIVERVVPIVGHKLPTSGILSFGFQRSATHVHNGIDLVAPEGTAIVSAAAGKVKFATTKWQQGFTGYGNVVVVENIDGTWSLYGHLKKPLVKKDDIVKAGQLIGQVGKTQYSAPTHTDNVKSGAHLHFEVSMHKYPQESVAPRLDPVAWLTLNSGVS